MGRVPGHEVVDLPQAYYEVPFEELDVNGVIKIKTGPLGSSVDEVLVRETNEGHLHNGGSEE